MMNKSNVLIIYYSKHQNNTLKLCQNLKDKYNFDMVNVNDVSHDLIRQYQTICFASGIYGFSFPKEIKDFITNENLNNKNVFIIYTCASNYHGYDRPIIKRINMFDNVTYLGTYSCLGYTTYGPFKLFNGIHKQRPNNDDILNCFKFVEDKILSHIM